MLTFELYQDDEGQFRWRLRAANGEIIASGEGYQEKVDCLHAVELMCAGAKDAKVEDNT